nr:uncharacterized protein CTRU02_05181 [Colletotrichum truncatum]KAF6794349.1 hypothetical protein CTRU02_05181 [Colletotrichum truncatum]
MPPSSKRATRNVIAALVLAEHASSSERMPEKQIGSLGVIRSTAI